MDTHNKKYLFFPKLNRKHLLFLLFLIIACIKKGAQIYFEQNQRLAVEFLQLYMFDIGDFLSIIPFFILKKRTKNKIAKVELNKIATTIDIRYTNFNPNDKKFRCITLRNIFIFTIINFIAQISSVIYYVIKEDQKLVVKQAYLNSTLIFNIIFVIIFSLLILHTKFYMHHLFALVLDTFCLIVLSIIDLVNIFKDEEVNISMSIIYILIIILNALLYSLGNVMAKYIFLFNFISTYALLLIKSIFHFIYLIIFSIPFISKKIGDKNGENGNIFLMIADIFEDKTYYLIIIAYTITSFFYNNLLFKIIDIFSPNHFTISRLLENVGIFIIDSIINETGSIGYLVLKSVMYIILIIAALIYNELLVINICNLGKNTQLFLDFEAENEMFLNKENDRDSKIEIYDSNNNLGSYEIELQETVQ